VKASPQVEGGNAMKVEIVPALRTSCSGYETYGNDEGNEPDAKNHRCRPIRMGQGQRDPYRRHVDEDHPPEKPAAVSYLLQSRSDYRRGTL
jgi:hypothetical protein